MIHIKIFEPSQSSQSWRLSGISLDLGNRKGFSGRGLFEGLVTPLPPRILYRNRCNQKKNHWLNSLHSSCEQVTGWTSFSTLPAWTLSDTIVRALGDFANRTQYNSIEPAFSGSFCDSHLSGQGTLVNIEPQSRHQSELEQNHYGPWL